MIYVIIIAAVLVVIALFVMTTYNSLVSLKNKVKDQWSQIEVLLKRREQQDKDRTPVLNYFRSKNLLVEVNGEGGIGDEIINIRFMDNFKKLGMNPILFSSWHMYRPDMVDLFKRHGHNVVTTTDFFLKDYLYLNKCLMILESNHNYESIEIKHYCKYQPL